MEQKTKIKASTIDKQSTIFGPHVAEDPKIKSKTKNEHILGSPVYALKRVRNYISEL